MRLSREWILAGILATLLGYAYFADRLFVTGRTQLLLAPHIWELALVTLAMFLIILIGGIDLSVGSTVALSAIGFGLAIEQHWPVWQCCLVCLSLGSACGLVNGVFVAYQNVHPLLISLATMSLFRGIAEGISLGRPISGLPENFVAAFTGVSPPLIVGLVAALFWIGLSRFRIGRWLVALGQNEIASHFSKIPVKKIKFTLYILTGSISGLAALLLAARNNSVKADIGTGMELEAITAVVLGGASIHGGKGSIVGTLLGILLLHELREFVSWHWKASEFNLIAVGAVLIAAVALQELARFRIRRNIAQNES